MADRNGAEKGTGGPPAEGPVAKNTSDPVKGSENKFKAGGDTAAVVNGQEVDFKKISVPEALQVLQVSESGLTEAEVKKRIEQYGPNKLPEKKRIPFLIYLGYLNNPLSWAMEAAAILAICLLDFADFGVIIMLLLTNATISYVEESSADKSIKALTSGLAPKAKVLRDGKVQAIDAAGLVPGDVITVRIGDIVPADIKLLGSEGDPEALLHVDQAALTGEALPVKKPKGDTALSGSTIKQGEMQAVVFATGVNSFFGRTAALIQGTENVANIQKIMTSIGAMCLATIGVWIVIELAVQFGHYHHECRAGIDGCPTLINMLVVLIGGIPIAMPTVLSVTLALGAGQLAKEGAIVARMSAVEEMAGMDVLCSDKTGTLTLNQLSVEAAEVLHLRNFTVEDVMKCACLSAQDDSEEAIDIVLKNSYSGHETIWQSWTQSKYIPFNPTDKFTVAHVRNNSTGEAFRLLKGAPQVILRMSDATPQEKQIVEDKIKDFALRGYRALGIAKGDMNTEHWEMLGLLPLFDPPRHDTADTIKECMNQGIRVKMVTGDQLLIGKEVAKQLNMGTDMYTTESLMHLSEAEASELCEKANGFAEVFPEHKYRVVEILQKRHHLVGMTGDGVNDAPALKKADVGIAVAGATEAARGAADIVLTAAGLSTIVTAIIGARKIFQRMNTYAKYTIAMTFRICFTFGILTTVYNWYFPALLVVLLAVFNDGAMIALAKDRVVPSRTPSVWRLSNVFITGIVYGIYLSLSTWVLFYLAAKTPFFSANIRLPDLNNRYHVVEQWCRDHIPSITGLDPGVQACRVPQYADQFSCSSGPSLLDQCMAEQGWFRNSMLRTMIYLQVSVSGQALVFVVRDLNWSLRSRAGGLTYLAFFVAQFLSTVVALFGFNGYVDPRHFVRHCQFCLMSNGSHNRFFASHHAPKAYSEGLSTDSIVGCLQWVVVSWIWAIIWYMPLDPIKWAMAYILNEDGFRDQHSWHQFIREDRQKKLDEQKGKQEAEMMPAHVNLGGASWQNPLGRTSLATAATPMQLERASVMRVSLDGDVLPVDPPQPTPRSLGRRSLTSMSWPARSSIDRNSVTTIKE